MRKVARLALALAPLLSVHSQPVQASSQFLAGLGKAEITPPPGFPTGGHGPAGQVARGYWSRLYTRAFYLRDKSGHAVVLASSDLFAFPLAMHAEVWNRVARKATAAGLEPQDLILAATHTHQGPGNYLTSKVYNEFGSSYGGFSKDLYRFLADRIASAIEEAIDGKLPSELLLHRSQVPGDFENQFVMNRSPAVFMLNWDRAHTLDTLGFPDLNENDFEQKCRAAAKPLEPADGWDLEGCPRLRAVDRRLLILEIRRDSKTVGALVFFAVHPTVLLHSAPLYNSDFVGLAVDSLERDWSKALGPGARAVAGFFNGAEGDITARRTRRDVLEVLERAGQFRKAIDDNLTAEPLDLGGDILVRGTVVDTRNESERTCKLPSSGLSVTLAGSPVFGTAAIGGAELDRTPLYALGWREGVVGQAVKGQGPKQPALDDNILHLIKLTSLLAPAGNFPLLLPVSYVRIGKLTLGALPVEMSATQALRIREYFERPDRRDCCFQILGLANEYSSYVATSSEYAAQDYMGASTIWGPDEGDFFQCQLETLQTGSPKPFRVSTRAYRPGPGPSPDRFGPTFVGQRRELPDEGLGEILLDRSGAPARHLPVFEWDESIEDSQEDYAAAANRTIVVRNSDDHAIVDDDDNDFIKMLTCAPDKNGCPEPNQRHWAAIWIKPLWAALPGHYQFEVTLNQRPTLPLKQNRTRTVLTSPDFRVNLTDETRPRPMKEPHT